MNEANLRVRAGIESCLARLWRYAVILSGTNGAAAEDLVRATCRRAIVRADELDPESRLDRQLFAILRSIWLNENHAGRLRESREFVDARNPRLIQADHIANGPTSEVLRTIGRLPREHRETVLLVFAEGYSYTEAASALDVSTAVVASWLAAARLQIARLKVLNDSDYG
jgi:RNA polymerase sigma-70 factor (ECF subfamily)